MVEKRIKSQGTDKTQTVKQQPTQIKQGTPSATELANLNPKGMIIDEVNGALYIKGAQRVLKITGVLL